MINPKTVINRAVGGAINGAIGNVLQNGLSVGFDAGPLSGGVSLGLDGISGGLSLGGFSVGGGMSFGGFGNLFSGNAHTTQGKVVTLSFKPGHPYASYPGIMAPLNSTGGVAWPYRPNIDIASAVNYEIGTPVHSMQDFRSFRNNTSANITITGQFTSQTIEEGRYTLAVMHFFRTARLMSFGQGGSVPSGMPPPVLNLNAYGKNQINNVPVVLDAMLQSLPNDVDYIEIDGNQVPTIISLTAACTLMLAPEQLRYFSLDAYAAGNMQNYL